MPNWVTNNITVRGEENVRKFKEVFGVSFEEGMTGKDFDFNKVIPMPQELRIDAGWSTYNIMRKGQNPSTNSEIVQSCMEDILANNYNSTISQADFETVVCNKTLKSSIFRKKADEGIKELSKTSVKSLVSGLAKSYFNLHRFGYTDWYNWSCDKWGTKWNAVDPMVNDTGNVLYITFDTAWSTPESIFKVLAGKGIDFSVSFADEDLGVNLGLFESENGTLRFIDITGEYDSIASAVVIKCND